MLAATKVKWVKLNRLNRECTLWRCADHVTKARWSLLTSAATNNYSKFGAWILVLGALVRIVFEPLVHLGVPFRPVIPKVLLQKQFENILGLTGARMLRVLRDVQQ
jgi:hypothetical protein